MDDYKNQKKIFERKKNFLQASLFYIFGKKPTDSKKEHIQG